MGLTWAASLTDAAVLGVVPTTLAGLTVARHGVETCQRRLEYIRLTKRARA